MKLSRFYNQQPPNPFNITLNSENGLLNDGGPHQHKTQMILSTWLDL